MTHDHHDTYVEREGTGIGTVLGIILAIVVVLAIVWFFFLGGMGNRGGGEAPAQNQETQVEIQPPAIEQPPVEQPAP